MSLANFIFYAESHKVLVYGGEYKIHCDGKNHILVTMDRHAYISEPCNCE